MNVPPEADQAPTLAKCGSLFSVDSAVMAETVICSPPTMMSSGRSPALVVHGGPVFAVTLMLVAVVVTAADSSDPSVSTRPSTVSSRAMTFHGLPGLALIVAVQLTVSMASVYPSQKVLIVPGGRSAAGLLTATACPTSRASQPGISATD